MPRRTRKAAYEEWQEHGYEVELIGARADRLVLASVKSFLGSKGVRAEHVTGETTDDRWRKSYALLNDEDLRQQVVQQAAERYGYDLAQVEVRLLPRERMSTGSSSGPTHSGSEPGQSGSSDSKRS